MSTASEATLILTAMSGGDRSQVDRLMELVYVELRGLARRYLARGPAQEPLQPTELVHEAFLKLVDHHQPDWRGRSHFYAVAATAMRQVLVDVGAKIGAQKLDELLLDKAGAGGSRTSRIPGVNIFFI